MSKVRGCYPPVWEGQRLGVLLTCMGGSKVKGCYSPVREGERSGVLLTCMGGSKVRGCYPPVWEGQRLGGVTHLYGRVKEGCWGGGRVLLLPLAGLLGALLSSLLLHLYVVHAAVAATGKTTALR